MNDRLTLVKGDGTTIEDIPGSVQGNKIFIMQSTPLMEEGDILHRRMSNGAQEAYRIVDSGFKEAFHGIPAHYQMIVEKIKPQKPNHPNIESATASQEIHIHNSIIGAIQTGDQSVANLGDSDSSNEIKLNERQGKFLLKLIETTKGNPGTTERGDRIGFDVGYINGEEEQFYTDVKGLEIYGFVKVSNWLHRTPFQINVTPNGIRYGSRIDKS